MLIKIKGEAEAHRIKALRDAEAEAEAESIRIRAHAQAEAIFKISLELEKTGDKEAVELALSKSYVKMNGEMGSYKLWWLYAGTNEDLKKKLFHEH